MIYSFTKPLAMKRLRTVDREAAQVLVSQRLGKRRSLTPEGYLFCEEVAIARVGEMVYLETELVDKGTPVIKGSTDGLVHITRDAAALFSPETIASFNGKPIIVDHPPGENVTPKNFKKYVGGVVLNPRRGDGEDADVLLADLLIQDQATIAAVQSGKIEVSAGYEADYEQTAPGLGRQHNIIGNHAAIVDIGRCGPRCAIGDHSPTKELNAMATANTTPKAPSARRTLLAAAMRKVFNDSADEIAATMTEAELGAGDEQVDGAQHIHIHMPGANDAPANMDGLGGANKATVDEGAGAEGGGDNPLEQRVGALEGQIGEILELVKSLKPATPAPTGDDGAAAAALAAKAEEDKDAITQDCGMPDEVEAAKKITTGDSGALATSFQAVVADAEVLVPGFRVPEFQAAAKRKVTLDSMCALRRQVVTHMANTADGHALLSGINGAVLTRFADASCAEVATLYRAAAAAKRGVNNAAATHDANHVAALINNDGGKPTLTLAQVNAANRKFYGQPTN